MAFITEWQSGLPETVCGRGSKLEETAYIRNLLPLIVQKYDIKTVADVGCGDQNWIKHVQWDVEYSGFDIAHQEVSFDCTKDVLPKAYDLVLLIYVTNHFKEPWQASKTLQNLHESGSRYLLCTTCSEHYPELFQLERWFHKETPRNLWYYALYDLLGSSIK